MSIKTIFCANEQTDTEHKLAKSSLTGDLLAICSNCERTLKFPGNVTNKQFDNLLSAHESANKGQQTIVPGQVGPPDVVASSIQPDAPDPGPRTQDNLTDAERAIWEQTNRGS